jgi:tetratricopeptide (TPR) repeat protein
MKHWRLICLFCISACEAFNPPAAVADQARGAISHIVNCEFDAAFAVADSLCIRRPDDPMGPLVRLLALGLRDLDAGRVVDSAGFLNAYTQVLARAASAASGDSSYVLTIAGFARATYASFYLHQNKYFAALGSGLDAIEALRTAQRIDSANHDADFFLGLYEYAKSELKRKLWMVMFWYPGDRQAGIRRLENAARRGLIVGSASRMALIDIYIKEKRYEDARRALALMRTEFPDSRFIRWSEARYYESRGRGARAAEIYRLLWASYRDTPHGAYNSLVCGRNYLQALAEAGRSKDIAVAGELILSAAHPSDNEQRRIYEDIQKMVKKYDSAH